MDRRGIGLRGIEWGPLAPACGAVDGVAAVTVLRIDVLRVMMPSLGGWGGAVFSLGRSSSGDGDSMTLRLISSARSSASSSSLTLVFLVYFFSKIRRVVMVMVKM